MRRFKPFLICIAILACASGARAVTVPVVVDHPGDLEVARTAGRETVSSHVYRNQVAGDFASFWSSGTACSAMKNLFVRDSRLDAYLYKPKELATMVMPSASLPISISDVTCHMTTTGSPSGRGAGDNKIHVRYATQGNYIEGTYSLRNFQVEGFKNIGVDPRVRVYFDAVLDVTLSAPVSHSAPKYVYGIGAPTPTPVPNGPVTVVASSVSVSNVRASYSGANAATIQGLVANLGRGGYNPPNAAWVLVWSKNIPWPGPPSCCFLKGSPFPGWTKWLNRHFESTLSSAAPGFSEISLMNDFLQTAKSAGFDTTQLTFLNGGGVMLISSGAVHPKSATSLHLPTTSTPAR